MSEPEAAETGVRRAAAEVVRAVLRGFGRDGEDDAETAGAGGWFRGARDCAALLARISGAPVTTARAFGGEWPIVRGSGWCLAPALPLALRGSGGDAVDGAYTVRDGAVWREAAGFEELFLTDTEEASPGEAFDLLWFGDSERYTVRRGFLEVEDLFALVEVPVDRSTLEKILVRSRRVDAAVLDGLTFDQPGGPARVTTNRSVTLTTGERWRDAAGFLRARADIDGATRRGDRIEAKSVHGASVLFACDDRSDGWTLRSDGGDYPLTKLTLRRRGGNLSISADLHPAVDPLSPGMRGRLAFDLRSDLVALG